jgi:HEAT repeat protein
MKGSSDSPPIDHVIQLLERNEPEEARTCLEIIQTHPVEDRKSALRSLRAVTEDSRAIVEPLCPALTAFLEDEARAVRLSTAKLLVAIAEVDPASVEPVVEALASRLADDDEFYYVRARCAEALGYVALDYPEAVASPETLADLRIGLSFDESEVKEKLAKALEHVALGDPSRLRHQVPTLADHLDNENELVRYHLATALVVVGCEFPDCLDAATDALRTRLDDENEYVQGRAAEALGLLAGSATEFTMSDEITDLVDVDSSFVAPRAQFAVSMMEAEQESPSPANDIGTIPSIRGTTDDIVTEITSPDTAGECPHCGLSVPDTGPPMCPRCGAPY